MRKLSMAETRTIRNPDATLSSYDRAGMMTRFLIVLALVASTAGCFGYNKSAKKWAYVGNTVLILGGGAAITADILTNGNGNAVMPAPAAPTADPYEQPISGGIVAGVLLVGAGIVGVLINATRPDVKTTR
jgi:hypothetical protein